MTTSPRSNDSSTRSASRRRMQAKRRGKTTIGSLTEPKRNMRITSKLLERCAVVVLHTDEFGVYQPEVVWWDDAWRDIEWE